jgi:response regulator RpfG family c-di-GMP phosphodiesterase
VNGEKVNDEKVKSKRAILCVDDEIIILLSLVEELKHAFGSKFLYEQAIDAESALKIVKDLVVEHVQVIFIISDWLMPGMKGDEFLEVIHEQHPDIQAIMITGQADDAALQRLKNNNSIRAIFSKPWNPSELVSVIEKNSVDD